MSARYIAHIDMDAFFAAVEQRDHPEFRGKPVVIGSDPKSGQGRGVVATCSFEAPPVPVIARLTAVGAYSNTGMPASMQIIIRTPRT